MIVDPFQRFLGVPETSEPRALLGLGEGPLDRVGIETALQNRLEKVFRHPGGRSDEAERVRRGLRAAAANLIHEMRRPAGLSRSTAPSARLSRAARPPQLTEFDRLVMAILVGNGGWNARSRAQLVALAGAHGLSAEGLMKVVAGLSEYARRGGPRLGVREITSGSGRIGAPALIAAPAMPRAEEPSILERVAPEFTDDNIWSTIKLSALFGFITVIVGIFVVRSVLRSDEPPPAGIPPERAAVDVPSPLYGPPSPTIDGGAHPTEGERLAQFRPLPTFLGNAVPIEAMTAADECPLLPQCFDEITRKLSITDDPAEPVYRNWEVSIETISTGWVLVPDSTRRLIDRGIEDALHETADAPSVADRLLESLAPSSGRLIEPVDLWRGAWRAGTLGSISASRSLPPTVVQQARSLLGVALGPGSTSVEGGFTGAATAWLDQSVVVLVEQLEYEQNTYDYWESWLAAHRCLGKGERFNTSLMSAIERILRTGTSLSRPGPSVNVLGRLLTDADFQSSAVARETVLRMFNDYDRINDHDLWVLTSLLAQLDTAPWFGQDLVLPSEAGMRFRNRIRDRLAATWPPVKTGLEDGIMAKGRGIPVDALTAARWRALARQAAGRELGRDDVSLMEQLVIACRINEAAAFIAAHNLSQARMLLDSIEQSLSPPDEDAGVSGGSSGSTAKVRVSPLVPGGGVRPSTGPTSPAGGHRSGGGVRPGQAIGRDGEWTAAYAEARRNTEEKLKWLSVLRTNKGTDLGPVDAETFVREVYRGSPQDVRSLARSILVQHFATGPNVAMEMLDQFPDSPHNENVSEALRQLTGRVLPAARSESWELEARLALTEHALSLRRGGESPIDQLAELLIESFASRLAALRREQTPPSGLRTPQQAVALLVEAWRQRAQNVIASDPAPDDLAGLQRRRATRRRLMEGPIQSMLADQLAVLDLLTYITIAEQHAVRDEAIEILADSAAVRWRSSHVLAQAIEVERAIARMWALRMALTDMLTTVSEVER